MYKSKKHRKHCKTKHIKNNMTNIICLNPCDNNRLLKGITINHPSINDFIITYSNKQKTENYMASYYDDLPFWSNDDDDDEINYSEEKQIFFYSDVYNENTIKKFNSLKEFEIFCTQNNYKIYSTDYTMLMNNNIIHCCVDPIDFAYDNETNLICEPSYSTLYWTVYEDTKKMSEKNNIMI